MHKKCQLLNMKNEKNWKNYREKEKRKKEGRERKKEKEIQWKRRVSWTLQLFGVVRRPCYK